MITGRQVRAARALLGWKQETLADYAQVALTALKRFESERALGTHESTNDKIRRALEAAGVVFMESEQGIGILLLDHWSSTEGKTVMRRGR